MNIKVKKYLIDVKEAITHIEEFTINVNSFSSYKQNLLIRRAVERELEIIGEAINRILNIEEEIEIQNSRRIVDLRNRVIHGYDKVDDLAIWSILKTHIPTLKADMERLLKNSK